MEKSSFWGDKEKEIIIHENGKMNVVESCVGRHALSLEEKDKLAFVFEDESGERKEYTYFNLEKEINKFANLLESLSVEENSRIALFLPKIPELYISFLGIIKHGSIAVPLFEAFQPEGLELRLERGDIKVLVTNKELYGRFEKISSKFKNIKVLLVDSPDFRERIKSQKDEFKTILKEKEETCLMSFTSSTAGTPVAGIEISHYALVQQHYTAGLVLDLKPGDKYFCTAHPGWVTGSVYGILAPLSIGCAIYVYTGHFDAKRWISFLKKNKISVVYTAPTALRMLKGEIKEKDLKDVRNLCSVGEALTLSVFDFYKKLGIEINDTYWQTETGAIVIANWHGLKKKKASMGKAIPGVKAKIIDGTISLKPDFPSLMTGIYKHEKMYKDYFKNGWFRTNDSAREDKEGYFFFIGRKDDIIKTSGERVSPIEIESELEKHPAVREAAVVGIPDEIRGSILKAFVVLQDDFKNKESSELNKLKEELSMFVKKNYAGHSYPKEIEFIEKLPKTNSGKIIRMKLRDIEES